MRALLMLVGRDWYAVPMVGVREVVAAPAVTVMPAAPECLVGLLNVRGEILPLFDLSVLLGLAPVERAPFATIVETELGGAGLVATGFPESVELGEPVDVDVVTGKAFYAVESRVAVLVEIGELLSPARIAGWPR